MASPTPEPSTGAAEPLFVGSSEVARLMRQMDWAQTPVGAVQAWPHSVRALIRMMLTSRYAMWMGWGPDLTFFYNDAYARMTLGGKHPWALGRQAREVWAEIWPDIGPRIEHVLATGEATWDQGLLLFLERSGFTEETYHTFSYSPLHGDDGAVAGMFCVVTEETDRIIDERRLDLLRELGVHLGRSQSAEDIWRASHASLADNACDLTFTLVYLCDDEGTSLSLASTTNVPPGHSSARASLDADGDLWPLHSILEGVESRRLVDLPPSIEWPTGPWPRPASRAILIAIPQQGQTRPAGVFIAGLNPYRPVDAAYESFVTLYVGQLAAALANVQAYAAEHRRAEVLAELDRAKTTFFSNISHELRTPLTLMLAPIAEALAAEQPALRGPALELVHRNGLRLRRLVNGLLDFSRIEAGRMRARFEPINLELFTAGLASSFESVMTRAGLRLVVDIEPGTEPTYVDRDMWEKIVLNLVSNAFKFTNSGQVIVSLRRQDATMVLQVRDTGTGIPTHELPHIFDRFHRVEGARGRTQEGTGIGLALVQELVKLHGGSVEVSSLEGIGTTFTVAVPCGTRHLPPGQISPSPPMEASPAVADALVGEAALWIADDTEPAVGTGEGTVPARSAAARILLADDNADMRAYLGQLLGARWAVDVAPDGEAALDRIRRQRPDLVVTDVMMPRLDGFGLLEAIRRDDTLRDLPVMMLSARAGEEAHVEGFQAGADDYLVKPFTARELMARVEAQLLRARIRSVENENRQRMAQVFMHAPVGIAILRGPTHVYELANPPYLEFVDRHAVIGRPIREVLPELEGQGIFELLDRVYATGEPYVGRSRPLALKRGLEQRLEEVIFDFVYQPTVNAKGDVDSIVVVAFDVTALARARQEAEDANRAKDEFLAMLGHELRNPLAPILTALQLLRLRGTDVVERERSIIERQVRHLMALVDDLLDVSRITRGKLRLTRVLTELSEAVAKGIEQASPLLEQHQHDLTVDVSTTGLTVMGDPERLAQIVSNLLTNAAKYTLAGGRIQVSGWREGDEVVLSVRDSGIGIDAQTLPQIFDLFTQDRQALDRAHGGLGLGLAIVRSLVMLHDGSVGAYSEGPGCGSEFVVRLPHVARAEPRAATRAAPRAPSTGLRVLVVDDNKDAALLLCEALAQAGHESFSAHDGPAALQAVSELRPSVALVDIGLPVMDGFEVARQLRANKSTQSMRLIAVTGYGQEHDRQRTAAAGFDAHLVKPVDLEQVFEALAAGQDGHTRTDRARRMDNGLPAGE